jgi:hypothetical protein
MTAERLYRWTDNRRKMAASGIAMALLMVYAVWQRAPFDEVANAVEWILGIFVTGHAVAGGVNAWQAAGSGSVDRSPRPTPPPLPRKS